MTQPPGSAHPQCEASTPAKKPLVKALEVDTFDGKLHVEWDPSSTVTSLGQLPFFIQFLKPGHRF